MSPAKQILIWLYNVGDSVMWALAILSVPFWLYVAIYAAPKAQIIAQQQEQDAIWRENRAFCENHGMPTGTREHTQCTKDLMEIRTKEERRITSDAEGIF